MKKIYFFNNYYNWIYNPTLYCIYLLNLFCAKINNYNGRFTTLKISIRTADETSTKLPVTVW